MKIWQAIRPNEITCSLNLCDTSQRLKRTSIARFSNCFIAIWESEWRSILDWITSTNKRATIHLFRPQSHVLEEKAMIRDEGLLSMLAAWGLKPTNARFLNSRLHFSVVQRKENYTLTSKTMNIFSTEIAHRLRPYYFFISLMANLFGQAVFRCMFSRKRSGFLNLVRNIFSG